MQSSWIAIILLYSFSSRVINIFLIDLSCHKCDGMKYTQCIIEFKINHLVEYPKVLPFFSNISPLLAFTCSFHIKPDTPINIYARFSLFTAKSKFSLVSPLCRLTEYNNQQLTIELFIVKWHFSEHCSVGNFLTLWRQFGHFGIKIFVDISPLQY